MAASTMKSVFLFRHLEAEFLANGGDENWLISGLEVIPEKLRKLEKINNILAHQPWKLKEQDLIEISTKTNPNFWQINELVQPVIILSHFHRLATIIESLKLNIINNDNNQEFEIFTVEEKLQDSKIFKHSNEDEIKIRLINEIEIINNSEVISDHGNTTNKRKLSDDNNSSKLNSSFENIVTIEDFNKHISNYCTVYLDFDSHAEDYKSYLVKNNFFNIFFLFI